MATPPTIGLAMIVKELKSKNLHDLIRQVIPHVDEIVVVEANKKAEPVPADFPRIDPLRLDSAGVRIEHYEWNDDFAAARNYSFSFLNTDWLFWLDDDDLLEGAENLRKAVEEAERGGIGCVHLIYEYRFDQDGRPTVVQTRERLMKRDLGWTWRDRVHEYCAAEKPHAVGIADDIKVIHQSRTVETARNLRLLQMMLKDEPDNPRVWGALGQTYSSLKDYDRAIEYTEGFFHRVGNLDLKWTAATELAKIHSHLKDWTAATQWAHAAMDIHPEYALSYLLLAHVAWFGYQDSARALLHIDQAEGLAEAPLHVERQPNDYTLNRWDVEHRALYDQGRYTEALQIIAKALPLVAEKDKSNWNYYTWLYHERANVEASVQGAYALVNHLFCRGDTLAARDILASLPVSVREDERILALKSEVGKATAHVFDDELYAKFYEANHSSPQATEVQLNAVAVETYRMDPLIKRLKARGAKRILDVGCGAGEPAIYLADAGFHVVGIDVNNLAIKEAKWRAKRKFGTLARNGAKALRCEFRQGTLDTLGPEDLGHFDAVVMMEIIEHVHPNKVPFYLGCCEDFLNPGGAVFITTPGMLIGDIPGIGKNFPRDHVKEYTQADLEALIASYPGRRMKKPMSLFKLYDKAVPVPGFATWFMEYESYTEALVDKFHQPAWDEPVVIYVGPGLENWTPDSPDETGIGGSETWAVKVARELRALGHPVIVYAMAEGVWEGVVYRDYTKYDPKMKTWLTVVSRYIEMLDERPNADKVLFVAHDTDYGDALTEPRLANMDAYCVMSEWQAHHTRSAYDGREDDLLVDLHYKLRIISNGIEPSFFEDTAATEKKRHSFVWSSSPDRGLDVVLNWWGSIRAMWPDATLSIAYGFDNIDALAEQRPWLYEFKARIMALAKQDGVTLMGRMGQRALAKLMSETHFWLYPATDAFGKPWNETFCITALEAQMAGCVPIIPSVGALPERLYYGYMSENQQLSESEVLDALQSWDAPEMREKWAEYWHDARSLIAADYDWKAATERLLALVREPVAV